MKKTLKPRADRHREGYTEEYNKATYEQIHLRVRKDSGLPEALEKAVQAGYSKNDYITEALRFRLIVDEFLKD